MSMALDMQLNVSSDKGITRMWLKDVQIKEILEPGLVLGPY